MLRGRMDANNQVQFSDEGGGVVVIVGFCGSLEVLDFDSIGVLVLERNKVSIQLQEWTHRLEAYVSLGGLVVFASTRPTETDLWARSPRVK
jgi:hypothetical protein